MATTPPTHPLTGLATCPRHCGQSPAADCEYLFAQTICMNVYDSVPRDAHAPATFVTDRTPRPGYGRPLTTAEIQHVEPDYGDDEENAPWLAAEYNS